MNLQVCPPSSISSSTGSRVVPATSSTKTRCSPASAFNKLDFPTFGRPTIAILRNPSSGNSEPTSGNSSTNRSSKSPEPRPCSAETKWGSPNPKFQSACAFDSSAFPSTLLAINMVFLPDRRSKVSSEESSSRAPT